MAYKTGNITGHYNLVDQVLRPFLKGEGTYTAPVFTGTGNGTLTSVLTYAATVTETWTVKCITPATNGGTFSVVGSVSGAQANAFMGTYTNGKIGFTLTDGSIDFALNDQWTIAATQGALSTENRAWTEMEYNGGTNRLLQLKAPGLTSAEEIYVGIRTYQDIPLDYYNLSVFGATGYVPGNTYLTQPGFSGAFGVPMWNQDIQYWLVANGQRCCCVAKIQNVYETFYLGKMLPNGSTPSQYPYPLVVGGMLTSEAATRYSETTHQSWHMGGRANFRMRFVDGAWLQPRIWHQAAYMSNNSITLRNTNTDPAVAIGSYGLYAMEMINAADSITGDMYGFLDGVYFVPGYNNSAENIITVGGVQHLVVPNVYRTGAKDYIAVRLQ